MEEKVDIVALGELLIDFTERYYEINREVGRIKRMKK